MNIPRRTRPSWGRFCLSLALAAAATAATAQTTPPTPSLVDPDLTVRTAVTGLSQPINLAFIGRNDMFVLEKGTGRVQRVVDGAVHSTVLDLAVNSASERGLLGIALHPDFRKNGWVYLFWSESSTGADSTDLASVPLLGNRVDRYKWNGTTLTHDRNLIRLRAFQADAGQPLRGNHNGGVIVFGPEDGHHGDRDDDDDDDDATGTTAPARWTAAATAAATTATGTGTARTARPSSTSRWATPAGAARPRTWKTGLSAPACPTISSGGPSRTTRT